VALPLDGTKVLVTDDNADAVEILHYLICQQGGSVRSSRTGRGALEALLTWTPDILLLDISMPDMDGFQLLSTIRGISRLREVPAVAVTAHAYERDKDRCLGAGFVEHVAKPYDPDGLMHLVARLAPTKLPPRSNRVRHTDNRIAPYHEAYGAITSW
jgi:CheY-like chemotaxis protein